MEGVLLNIDNMLKSQSTLSTESNKSTNVSSYVKEYVEKELADVISSKMKVLPSPH
jgi:hypothetical protein